MPKEKRGKSKNRAAEAKKSRQGKGDARDACSIGQNGCCNRPVLLQAGTFSPATEKGFAGVFGGHEVISETYNIDYMEDMEKYGWNKNSAPFPSMVVVFRPKMEMLEGME